MKYKVVRGASLVACALLLAALLFLGSASWVYWVLIPLCMFLILAAGVMFTSQNGKRQDKP